MNCECGGIVVKNWRVWNWTNDNSDVWFETYNEAKGYYIRVVSEEPMLDWRLYEHSYCSECDSITEDCVTGQFRDRLTCKRGYQIRG